VQVGGLSVTGAPSYLFSHSSSISAWRAGVTVPDTALKAPVRNVLLLLALIGAVAVGAGLVGAWIAARRISGAVSALRAAGVALEADEPVSPLATPVQELNAVGEALSAAARERRNRAAQRELLISELNHRVKNNLAVVHALAVQTLRSDGSREEVEAALSARLKALATAHDLLTRENWDGAEIREVVEGAITPIAAGRAEQIILRGDPTLLPPRVALGLTMALHELSTNALKYGALSTAGGRVCITWLTLSDGVLRLEWKESGGPPVRAPERMGFGSKLLTRGVARDLGGKVEVVYEPRGVVCLITANLTSSKETRAQRGAIASAP
jgi:two-component sensor histidine kinase